MPKTLNKFCEIVGKSGKDSIGYYSHYLYRMCRMYGLSLMDPDYSRAYLAICNRGMELIEI
jgi:hypothetical protein